MSDQIRIKGIGVVSTLGFTPEEIWQRLKSEEQLTGTFQCHQKVPLIVKKNMLRRMDGFSYLGLYVTDKAIEDMKEGLENLDKSRVGTIFSTAYGPLKTNIKFSRQVMEDDPDLCSPSVFSNTVTNACLGQICMRYQLTGASTMLMGSNSLGYACMIMEEDKVDYTVAGSIEEYNEELAACLESQEGLRHPIAEGAVALFLATVSDSKEVESMKEDYCRITDFTECNLGFNPFLQLDNQLDDENSQMVHDTLVRLIKDNGMENKIDALFCSGSPFTNSVEQKVMEEVAPKALVTDRTKTVLGETLGVHMNMNVMLGALCLKKGEIPKSLSGVSSLDCQPKSIIVCGYDISGNYVAFLLEA